MLDVLLILHFVGLMLGAGGGIGSTVAMAYASSVSATKAKAIRGLGPPLAHISLTGLVLLWLSGLPLLFMKYSLSAMPVMFWMKMAFVALLTFAAIMIEITYSRVAKGDASAAALLPSLGPMAGLSSLMAVIFAALTFH